MSHEFKFWKGIGVGVTTYPLPANIVSTLKKPLFDDMQTLKYVLIDLKRKKNTDGALSEVETFLSIIDSARQYHLTGQEMRDACDRFVNNKNNKLLNGLQKDQKAKTKRVAASDLPLPDIGAILFRKDRRRGSSCKVSEVDGQYAKVIWSHSGKRTRISLSNLRNPQLYTSEKLS
jgi:hypothetical protein